jgi:hypothetical protein
VAAVDQRTDVEAFVAAFAEAWSPPNDLQRALARYLPLLAEDVRLVQPQIPTLVGHEQFRVEFAEPMFAMIPDLHGEVRHWAARGDDVYLDIEMRGTLGGRPVSFTSCDRFTLRDGLVAERVSFSDPSPLIAAILTRPRAWPAVARTQLTNLRRRLGRQ